MSSNTGPRSAQPLARSWSTGTVGAGLIFDAEKMFEAQTVAKGKASGGESAHAHCPALLSSLSTLVFFHHRIRSEQF